MREIFAKALRKFGICSREDSTTPPLSSVVKTAARRNSRESDGLRPFSHVLAGPRNRGRVWGTILFAFEKARRLLRSLARMGDTSFISTAKRAARARVARLFLPLPQDRLSGRWPRLTIRSAASWESAAPDNIGPLANNGFAQMLLVEWTHAAIGKLRSKTK